MRKYERNVTVAVGTNIPTSQGSFIQYVAHNVDHNLYTLDGHGTFHGMGIIAAITLKANLKMLVKKIDISAEYIREIPRYRTSLLENNVKT